MVLNSAAIRVLRGMLFSAGSDQEIAAVGAAEEA
jgi:hypothetical protein